MTGVSVVMACFNAAAYLERSISSIQQQDFPSWELIIVDDASTDHTQSIAQEFAKADTRIDYLRRPTNAGPSASRNTAIKRASGEWIAILDADDAYRPKRLSRLVQAGRNFDFVFDNLVLWDDAAQQETGIAVPIEAGLNGGFGLADLVSSEHPAGRWRYGFLKPIIRAEFLRDNRLLYDERLRLAEDFDLYARALLSGARATFVDEPLYLYTTQLGQRSRVRSLGTRTVFDYRSRVALADRLIADYPQASPDDMMWLRQYHDWQILYADALDIAAARKEWNLGVLLHTAARNPRAFLHFLSRSRWLSPLLDRR